ESPEQETLLQKKPIVSILDETLLTGVAKPGKLLCSLDSSRISLAAVDPATSRFLAFEVFQFSKSGAADLPAVQLDLLSETSQILKKVDYRNVSVQVHNRNFTFIPGALFKPDDAKRYYAFNH